MRSSILFFLFFALVFLSAPFIGIELLPLSSFLSGDELSQKIFWELRVPRVLLGFFAGGGLAVGGVVFQTLFRNPLASPYTVGVSSGAAFGVALCLFLGGGIGLLGSSVSLAVVSGFIGALCAVAVILLLVFFVPERQSMVMLLAGVVLSFFFSSLILFIQYLTDFQGVFQLSRWLMGSLSAAIMEDVYGLAFFVVLGLGVCLRYARELDVLLIGEELAGSRGVDIEKVQRALFIGTSLMIAGIVSFCGPIGFVGIIVPHICRSFIGHRVQPLLFYSFFTGSVLLILSDSFARTIIAPFEVPVGVITALFGGPFFLVLLLARRTRTGYTLQ